MRVYPWLCFLAALVGICLPYLILEHRLTRVDPPLCVGMVPIPMSINLRSEAQVACFDHLAQQACKNPEGSWSEIKPGVVQCLTKRGMRIGQPMTVLRK